MTISGKNCLVTGANTGLGLAISKRFAAMGAHTIMVCRSQDKGESAVKEIKEELPEASIELAICDLASIKSIHNFTDNITNNHSRLDILYNNAAVMKEAHTVTEDGFEMMFQVNYLAPFILMNSFFESLKAGNTPYIINNGRPSYKLRLDMDDLQFSKSYRMYRSFFLTKLCLLFATMELSRRSEGVTVTMIDPGPFKSALVRDKPLIGWIKNMMSAPVEKAADNILYHITSKDPADIHGKVFKEKKEHPLSDYWRDTNISSRLWHETESLLEGI